MTAKEFYELNKGKYFMYDGEKVKLVGYDVSYNSVLVTKKEGWNFDTSLNQGISYIDESSINKDDKLWFVQENELHPIEQPELDLCKLLEGCEGVELWSDIFGKCKLERSDGGDNYEIEVLVLDTNSGYNRYEQFTKYGRFYHCCPNGKCMLWPSETNRDWSTFEKPIRIKEGDPVMTKWNSAAFWKLESYTKDNKSDFIVPVSDFDFTDFDSNKSKSIK